MHYMFHQLSHILSAWQGHGVLIQTSFTLNFALIINGEMTYIQSSFAIQSVLPYRHTVKAALYSILFIQYSRYTEEWVVNKPLNLQP